MSLLVAAVLVGVVVLPHRLDLRSSSPPVAIALWMSALVMRAVLVVAAVASLVLFVPQTAVFAAATHWCWHAVLPVIATHLGLAGHRVGDAALLVPAGVIGVSALWAVAGVVRAARVVQRFVRRASLAPGPGDSVIIGGADVVVAAAGLRRPRVLVSAGALAGLDEEELGASLAHERGHIVRRHRWVLVVAELARAIGRVLPGTGTALRQLTFHVERDADCWAVRRRHDPLALASAICKAAASTPTSSPAWSALHGEDGSLLERRLDELTGQSPPPRKPVARAVAAALSVALTLGALALVPAATAAGLATGAGAPAVERHCAT